MKGYEFEKATRKEAQLAAANFTTTDTVRGEILQKAQDLGLAVEPDENRYRLPGLPRSSRTAIRTICPPWQR
jgi:hypothetical protein